MPESERRLIQFELERMINDSIKHDGANRMFETIHYMELVILAMSAGKRYNDLDEALRKNEGAYDKLHINASSAGMIAAAIRRVYFRGTVENVLVNGLARNDSQALATFLHNRLAQLKTAAS